MTARQKRRAAGLLAAAAAAGRRADFLAFCRRADAARAAARAAAWADAIESIPARQKIGRAADAPAVMAALKAAAAGGVK